MTTHLPHRRPSGKAVALRAREIVMGYERHPLAVGKFAHRTRHAYAIVDEGKI